MHNEQGRLLKIKIFGIVNNGRDTAIFYGLNLKADESIFCCFSSSRFVFIATVRRF